MAECAYCGTTIVFGGVNTGGLRFCNKACQSKAQVAARATPVSDQAVDEFARRIHAGPCPKCQGPGPVDMHKAHWVWSAVVFTRWGSVQQVSCRGCALKTQGGQVLFSLVCGWWGFPWGLIMTPVQVFRTLGAMVAPPSPLSPSATLQSVARGHLMSLPAQPAQPRWSLDTGEKESPVPDQWEERA